MNTQNAKLTTTPAPSAQIAYRASSGKLRNGYIDFTKIDEDCFALLVDSKTGKITMVCFSVADDLFIENVN